MKKVFKSIGYGLSVPWVLLAILFNLLSIKRKARKYKKDPTSIFTEERLRKVYKLFSKILYIKRVEVVSENIESLPAKQMLYIANHKDAIDPIVIFKVLYDTGKLGPISFICKNELSKKWYTRCVIELLDGIFIQRDNGRSIYECYLKETELIKKGNAVMVFPEGTRVPGDEFKEFNPTTLKVAFENFIAICPFVLYGSDKKRKAGNKKKIYISAFKPIQPNNFINIKKEQLMVSLQNQMIDKYVELRIKSQEKSK